MAAPNLNAPTTINGKTTYLSLADTTETTLLSNAASSGKAMRLTSLIVANTGASSADATATIYSAASAGTGYKFASSVAVPAYSSIVLLSRDASLWLEEDRRVTAKASAGNYLTFVLAYEEVS